MRIVLVTTSLSYGGAAKMLSYVADSLVRQGNEVAIANLQYVDQNERDMAHEIQVWRMEAKRKNKSKAELAFELLRYVKEYGADIIISFKYTPNLLATIVGKLAKIPVIISERADPTRSKLNSLKKKLNWAVINSADGGVFQLEEAKNCYKKHLRECGEVIPNPIFLSTDDIYDPKEKSIVTFGRLANGQKRYDIMLQAFKKFLEKHEDFILKIYGEGEDEENIKRWISEMGLVKSVKLMGVSSNPIADIRQDMIFLITSDFEGISNSMLEAMAAGFPVVATDCSPGGARMVISDRENGLLVPIRDVDRIANALSEFVENDQLRIKCAQNARSVTDRFSPETIGVMWNDYIEKIASMKRKKGKWHL